MSILKVIDLRSFLGDIPTMVTTTDKKKRITLSQAKPGDTFDVQQNGPGIFTLRLMKPVKERPSKVRLEKRGKHTVMIIGRPINNEELLKEIREMT